MSIDHDDDTRGLYPVTRRRFVQGVAAGAAVAAAGWSGVPAFGEAAVFEPRVLTGKHFDLTIDYLPVNFTGRRAMAMAVNGSVPGPVLRWREGDDVTIAVTNRMKVSTSLHWHSLRIPADMDGVPGLSFAGIAPGETFHYHFPVKQNGTAWYHSHTRFQEQSGIHGALIIDPAGEDPIASDREHVIFLSDWTDTNPETVFSNLKEESDYYNYQKHTVPEFIGAVQRHGFWQTVKERLMWARMNMSPSDISDVSAATYTYLLNGNAPAANWTGLYRRGEKVRLRYFDAQVGVREDLDSGPARTWVAIGMEGMAPYFFEFAPTLYIGTDGDVGGRINASYELLFTQRLIAEPQAELNFYSQDDRARGTGAGLSEVDTGIRLRYEFSRKFAPYVGFAYNGKYGDAAQFARADGERVSDPRFVFGVRAWF